MDKKIRVVIPTPLSKQDYEKTTSYQCLTRVTDACNAAPHRTASCSVHVIYNNTTGLSELYQQQLNDVATKCDIIVFMHDDVEVHDAFMFDKLVVAHQTYDIVGLAGSTSQDYTTPKLKAWHLAQRTPGDARGIVAHAIPQNPPYVNSVFFGATPSPVVVIDGLFISIKLSAVRSIGALFDPRFTFHFYDMVMCVNAVRKSLKIGVWPIFVIHHGLGKFQGDPVWEKLSRIFTNEYWDYVKTI